MHTPTLQNGARVRLAATSPIESEGVAPAPGHPGTVVEAPRNDDPRRCWGVRFEGLSLVWRIPEAHLEALPEGRQPSPPSTLVAAVAERRGRLGA